MLTLALAYLRDRPLTSALNILLLAISVAMLVLLVQFSSQSAERFERDARGIDLVVGAKGSPLQLILSSVFHIDQPTGNIPLSNLDRFRRDPAIARAVPLALGDNFEGYRIVGTDAGFLDLHQAQIEQGKMFDGEAQAVLGAQVAAETGAQLGQKFVGSHGLATDDDGASDHDHAPFETVGILQPTGSVIDRLILTSVESVWDAHGIEHDHQAEGHEAEGHDEDDHDHEEAHEHSDEDAAPAPVRPMRRGGLLQDSRVLEPELTALLITYSNASGAIRIPAMVNRQTALQAAVPATETARLLDLLGVSFEGARLFGWLLAGVGGLAIFVALFSVARSRESDLALLRVMGATQAQLFGTIILEGLVTAAIGALGGWVAAHSLLALARQSFPAMQELGLSAWQPVWQETIILAIVLVIGMIAAAIPAWRVMRVDPSSVLARAQ